MNIAEILKDAPKGTKLFSPLFGEVKLESVSDDLLDEGGNIVTYCYWSYVVPIDKFNFDDTHSSILNALQ